MFDPVQPILVLHLILVRGGIISDERLQAFIL